MGSTSLRPKLSWDLLQLSTEQAKPRLTCREVEAAPMRSPRDWATRAVAVARAEKSRKRVASGGWPVIQYTMLQ